MISSLSYLVKDRKEKLITYLNNNLDELSLEKQHQLHGAITELDAILAILENKRHVEIKQEKNPEEIFLFRPIHSKGLFHEIMDFVLDLF